MKLKKKEIQSSVTIGKYSLWSNELWNYQKYEHTTFQQQANILLHVWILISTVVFSDYYKNSTAVRDTVKRGNEQILAIVVDA